MIEIKESFIDKSGYCSQDGDASQELTALQQSPYSSAIPALREYPSRLFVETTTRCNLRCSMCVKQTVGNCIVEGDMSPAIFAALEPAFPHIEALILNGIGEPLLHRGLEAFIHRARALMPDDAWIGFQSNGLLLDEARAVSLVEAGLDRICISMDAVSPETFRKIREGGEVRDLEDALAALRFAKRESGSSLAIGLEFVVMRENARELPEVIAWAAARGVNFVIVSHLLPYEKEHMDSVAYDINTDEVLEFFKPWRERAQREGIDLNRFFRVIMNYLRSPYDQRVVDFVWEMQLDARSRDLFFNLKNLLQRDELWFEEISGIFAEAEKVARETGLELQLPAITPRSERKCDFVEKGAAFISWDGGVHNCYFLWHQFSCYSSKSKKYVQPKIFGNLSRQGIRDIWNTPEFRSYRQQVLRNEHPVCSNCSVFPCEYVYTEEFKQDCFTNTVACGDCFWCMGLFRCLQ